MKRLRRSLTASSWCWRRTSSSIQQLMHEKVMYAPLMDVAVLGAHGPRVAESAIGLITNMAASAPYEELRLKAK